MRPKLTYLYFCSLLILLTCFTPFVFAEQSNEISLELFATNNAWMLVATFMVFIMHLGFAMLESGMTRSKNTVNILFKNLSIVSLAILTYALIGFNLMYPGVEYAGKLHGALSWGLSFPEGGGSSNYNAGFTYWTDFVRQALFAATAGTIVSGAVAERIKFHGFLIFSCLYVTLVYPIVGMWSWGGGWLASLGFHDLAGSTMVHSVGGWAALAGAIFLGPRLGKYRNGIMHPIMGHNLPLSGIGVFMLWFGWYGFNGGSVLASSPNELSYVVATTTLSAAAGTMGAMLASWTLHKHPEFSMVLNGTLGGLVGITAGADLISPTSAVVVGFLSGVIVVLSVIFFDNVKIDDPVGAVSVHLICGIWGTLAVGLFADGISFKTQLLGVLSTAGFCFPAACLLFFLGKLHLGLRASRDEEMLGLDIGEHGTEAYSGFQIFPTQ